MISVRPIREIAGLACLLLGLAVGDSTRARADGASSHSSLGAVDRGRVFDTPADEDDLNREIWEASGRRDYGALLAYVKARQASTTAATSLPLPNGWALAPAGLQVAVGRLPFEGVVFRDRLVVLNAGHTGKNPQTVSVLDPASGQVVRTLAIPALYPSAVVGADGDLYISGGFGRRLHRYDANLDPVRTYPLAGYAGPVAALDRDHLVVGYLVAPKPSASASAAGSAKPMEARPLEISTSRGAEHSQKAVAENICAPASTLMRGLRPARRAASCASVTMRGGATPPVPCQVSAARIASRCAAIVLPSQALRCAFSISAVKAGAKAPCNDASGVT